MALSSLQIGLLICGIVIALAVICSAYYLVRRCRRKQNSSNSDVPVPKQVHVQPNIFLIENELLEKAIKLNTISTCNKQTQVAGDSHILLVKKEEIDRNRENWRKEILKREQHNAQVKTEIKQIQNKITALQRKLRGDLNASETVSIVQNYLLQIYRKKLELNITEKHALNDCKLIIGVDSTPANQAGYCVNLVTKTIQYYIINWRDLPWHLHNQKVPSEFEMKNFIFALTLWENDIIKWKRVRIYTDNYAISEPKYDVRSYGDRAFQVLNHYIECKGVQVLNIGDIAVNRFQRLAVFAQYIQPADDLSRFHVDEATNFLSKLYHIDAKDITGTHCRDKSRSKVWYEKNDKYYQILENANNIISRSDCNNYHCKRTNLIHASLRIGRGTRLR